MFVPHQQPSFRKSSKNAWEEFSQIQLHAQLRRKFNALDKSSEKICQFCMAHQSIKGAPVLPDGFTQDMRIFCITSAVRVKIFGIAEGEPVYMRMECPLHKRRIMNKFEGIGKTSCAGCSRRVRGTDRPRVGTRGSKSASVYS